MAGRVICARICFPGLSWQKVKIKAPFPVTHRFLHDAETKPVPQSTQYPKILDLSPEAKNERIVAEWAEYIKSLPSVEEKLYELNMPRYYGWWTCHLSDENLFYDSMSMLKLITRSRLENEMPEVYNRQEIQSHIDGLLPMLKNAIGDALSLFGNKSEANLALGIHRSLVRVLGSSDAGSHLRDIQSSLDARVEAFWTVGGITPDKNLVKWKKSVKPKLPEERVYSQINRRFQYAGRPLLLLKSDNPLPATFPLEIDFKESENVKPTQIPDPRSWGYRFNLRHGTNLPGHWPSTGRQFGFLSWLKQGEEKSGMSSVDTRQAQALQHLFGWTLAQATNLGFGPYTETTIPLRSQCLILKGNTVSAHSFQLNTCRLHDHHALENSRTNILHSSDVMELCHSLDGSSKGVNEQAVRLLANLYLQVPQPSQADLRPYLGPEHFAAEAIQDEKKRETFLSNFFHMYSNRPRHIDRPEIFMWEKIYKIDNKSRFQDARRRFFELGEYPLNRRYDDRRYKVLPRHLRDPPKKSRRGRLPIIPNIKL